MSNRIGIDGHCGSRDLCTSLMWIEMKSQHNASQSPLTGLGWGWMLATKEDMKDDLCYYGWVNSALPNLSWSVSDNSGKNTL